MTHKKHQRWTIEQDILVLEQRFPDKEIAEMVNRNYRNISVRRCALRDMIRDNHVYYTANKKAFDDALIVRDAMLAEHKQQSLERRRAYSRERARKLKPWQSEHVKTYQHQYHQSEDVKEKKRIYMKTKYQAQS